MEEILNNFSRQLAWQPKIEHEDRLVRAPRVILCGMGGSRLAGDLVRAALPMRDIRIHADFGFPPLVGNDTLFVVSSYSGNTEETLDAFRAIREKEGHVAVVTGGGALLKEARENDVPLIEMPEKGVPPRLAVGWSARALLSFIGEDGALAKVASATLPNTIPEEGAAIAERLKGSIPLVYASRRMGGLAYYWKVVLNETAKVHAFANAFPEAGHNEIEGYESAEGTRVACVVLTDTDDDERVRRRLALFSRMCREKETPIVPLALSGVNVWERIFRSVMLANWTALHLAKLNHVEPSRTALIDEWKRELHTHE